MTGVLLEDMASYCGCTFISDLKYLPEPDIIKVFVKHVSPSDYSIHDWNQTVRYFSGEKVLFESEEDARKYIIDLKLPRLL